MFDRGIQNFLTGGRSRPKVNGNDRGAVHSLWGTTTSTPFRCAASFPAVSILPAKLAGTSLFGLSPWWPATAPPATRGGGSTPTPSLWCALLSIEIHSHATPASRQPVYRAVAAEPPRPPRRSASPQVGARPPRVPARSALVAQRRPVDPSPLPTATGDGWWGGRRGDPRGLPLRPTRSPAEHRRADARPSASAHGSCGRRAGRVGAGHRPVGRSCGR